MKILIVGTAYPFRGGGISTFNQVLAAELQQQGHKVTILTFTLQYPKLLFPGKTQYSNEPAPENLHIEVKLNSINPFNWVKNGLHYKKQGYDLVIFRFWTPFMGPAFGTVARFIRSNKKSVVISITDNIIPHESSIIDKPFTSYFLSSCQGFVTMSKSVLKDLEQFSRIKPKTYHPHPLYNNFGNSVTKSEACKQLNLDEATNYILFFGFIRKYKGLDLMLEAMAEPQISELNIKLLVAGEFYEDSQPYFSLIKSKGIEDRVVWHNHFIEDELVKYYFSAASLIAQTYRHATQSGVTQIAFHFNKPMLVTNVGGLAEMIPHQKAGYVVNPTPSEIANAVADFFENNRYNDFAEEVEQQKEKFSWPSFISSLLSVYRAIKK